MASPPDDDSSPRVQRPARPRHSRPSGHGQPAEHLAPPAGRLAPRASGEADPSAVEPGTRDTRAARRTRRDAERPLRGQELRAWAAALAATLPPLTDSQAAAVARIAAQLDARNGQAGHSHLEPLSWRAASGSPSSRSTSCSAATICGTGGSASSARCSSVIVSSQWPSALAVGSLLVTGRMEVAPGENSTERAVS